MTTQDLLSPQELEHLAEVRDVTVTAASAGWMRIVREMERFVAEAHEDMFGAVYASDSVKANLQCRWQQREAMLRGIKAFVNECEAEKNTLVETLNTRGVPPEDYAEQDRDVA
jgi:hypothetical protein